MSARSFFQCDVNGLCLWQHINYDGDFQVNPANSAQKNYWYFTGNMDNRTSSMYNRRTQGTLIARLYPPSGPDIVCVPSQWAYSDLTAYNWPSGLVLNDKISSYNYLTSGC